MKIAFCLYGNLGKKSSSSERTKIIIDKKENFLSAVSKEGCDFNPFQTYNSIKNIINKYNPDIFLHSWSKKYEKEIYELYKPKKFLVEEQKIFDINLENYGINIESNIDEWKISNNMKEGYIRQYKHLKDKNYFFKELQLQAFRSSSKWYSSKISLELKKEYEEENNFKYDLVILTRFDLSLRCHQDFNILSKINFYNIDTLL
jgi:hypothetical protein